MAGRKRYRLFFSLDVDNLKHVPEADRIYAMSGFVLKQVRDQEEGVQLTREEVESRLRASGDMPADIEPTEDENEGTGALPWL